MGERKNTGGEKQGIRPTREWDEEKGRKKGGGEGLMCGYRGEMARMRGKVG